VSGTRFDFPTTLHHDVAALVEGFFAAHAVVDTVLVVNSCARGKATAESDLDMAVLTHETDSAADARGLESSWRDYAAAQSLVRRFLQSGRFAHVHVDIFDGRFSPPVWDDGGGPDTFEVEIGNRVAHAAPLRGPGPCFLRLRSEWLPYYGDDLRRKRLAMAVEACAYDLDHVPFFLRRGLCFQAFDRLYKAFQEFLQALFIARRTYPIAYNKWIREQVEEWLGLPDLYRDLPQVLSVRDMESSELASRAETLRALLAHCAR
jgi:predicted nucleotidyltransferase